MTDYAGLILAMKFGFSAVLLLTGLYGLYAIYRANRSVRAFLRLPAALAFILLFVSILLLTADHEKYYDFLNLVKIISGVFTLVYGIYATLNDFYEQDESGRRAITRIGMIGILLFFTSTILSIAADYVKNSIQKQEIDERRRYYASIVDKLVIVDQSTGRLNINFQKFTENLFSDLKRTQQELLETRKTLADREGKLSALERQLNQSTQALRQAEERIEKLTGDLGQTRERLANAEERGREALRRLEEESQKLERAGRDIEARTVELNGAQRNLKDTQDLLRRREGELARSLQEAARVKEELKGLQTEAAEWRRRGEEVPTLRENLGRREGELSALRPQLEDTRAQVRSLDQEARRLRGLLDERLAELTRAQRALEVAQKDLVALQKQLLAALEKPRPAVPEPGAKSAPGPGP